jgi:quinoprotein glucose dehydrogenase
MVSSVALVALLLAGCLFAPSRDSIGTGEWPSYGNDPGGTRYSPLIQVDRGNVANLRVAWTYRTGEVGGVAPYGHAAFEATPLMVDGTLILSTPYDRVIALDPETGKERWSYDPKVDRGRRFAIATSRGVATWLDTSAQPDRVCRRSVFVATIDARLIALDAPNGAVCPQFGRSGEVDLTEGIKVGRDCGCYQVTSPPAVIGDLVIVGSRSISSVASSVPTMPGPERCVGAGTRSRRARPIRRVLHGPATVGAAREPLTSGR